MRLRSALTIAMIAVASLTAGVAVALIALTSTVHQAVVTLGASGERIRLLMELESLALQQVHRAETVGEWTIRDRIERIGQTATPEYAGAIARLAAAFDALDAPIGPDRQLRVDAAIRELRALATSEELKASEATNSAAAWNRMANIIGIVAAPVLLVGVVGTLMWLWRRSLQPLMDVTAAMTRFAEGDRDARVPETGPDEVRHIAASFNEMAGTLRQQHERQFAFVGGVAHDLRAPLHAIQVGVSLLEQDGRDAPRVRERVRRQVQHIERMLEDLVDRTRIEAGHLELRRETVDLREVVDRVVTDQRAFAPSHAFLSDLPEHPVSVHCDVLRIEQVLNNLLSNAVKYSPQATPVEIALDCADKAAVLSVTDHGIGMSPPDRTRIFEAFWRGSNVGGVAGAGLGLSVARKIVEAHGGQIDVCSEKGAGSVFSVRLPTDSTDRPDHRSAPIGPGAQTVH